MTRRVRSWAIAALVVFALAGAATPSVTEIIYKVTNHLPDQNGWSTDGTITLSETGTYQTDSEILAAVKASAFEFTNGDVSDMWSFESTQNSAGVGWLDNSGGTLEATSSTLILGVGCAFSLRADAGRNFRRENVYVTQSKYQAGDGGRFLEFYDFQSDYQRRGLDSWLCFRRPRDRPRRDGLGAGPRHWGPWAPRASPAIGNAPGGMLVKCWFTSRAGHRKVLRPGLFYG